VYDTDWFEVNGFHNFGGITYILSRFYINEKYYAEALIMLFLIGIIIGEKYLSDFIAFLSAFLN